MFDRPALLMQVPIRGLGQAQMGPGQGFMGPFGIYSDIGAPGGYAPPPGFPAMSEEVSAPGGEATEYHCYECPDGTVRSLTIPQARIAGCQPLDYNDPRCPGLPKASAAYAMGQNGNGAAPSQVSVPPVTLGPSVPGEQPTFFSWPNWTWPLYPPTYPTSSGKMVCKKKMNEDGEEVFICEQPSDAQPMAAFPVTHYPTYSFTPFWF